MAMALKGRGLLAWGPVLEVFVEREEGPSFPCGRCSEVRFFSRTFVVDARSRASKLRTNERRGEDWM
jgi:hypothetical protein